MMIKIPIGKSYYQINCNEDEKDKIFYVAGKLNQRIEKMATELKDADDTTLLALVALAIEDELDEQNRSDRETKSNPIISESDIYDAVSENMENVADYIEKLTKKVQNF